MTTGKIKHSNLVKLALLICFVLICVALGVNGVMQDEGSSKITKTKGTPPKEKVVSPPKQEIQETEIQKAERLAAKDPDYISDVEYAKRHEKDLPILILERTNLGELQKVTYPNGNSKFHFGRYIIAVDEHVETVGFWSYNLTRTTSGTFLCNGTVDEDKEYFGYLHYNGDRGLDRGTEQKRGGIDRRCWDVVM